jgi:IclR family transcriptional regulator, mhp operon transcriptional activator
MDHDAVRALSRGLDVLDALDTSDGMLLRDLHRITALPKPTLLRLLATLESRGYVTQRLADGHWRRTLRGRSPTSSEPRERLLDCSKSVLRYLCKDVAWPSDIAIYREGTMEIIDTTRGLSPLAIDPVPVGLRVSLFSSGLGRAWLAYCDETEREQAIAKACLCTEDIPMTVEKRRAVEAALARTRRNGYGRRSRVGPMNPSRQGDIGIAVPIASADRLLGCINIVWRSSAMDETMFVRRYLPRLREAADAIGARASNHTESVFERRGLLRQSRTEAGRAG